MITLSDYTGNNVTLFKQFELDLNKKGITHIIGRNLNSDMKDRNNGSGKTLLFYGLEDILTGSNRKILSKGKAKGNVSLDIDNLTYTIVGTKKEYYLPTSDNKADKVNKKVFDETIREVFPISKTIFDSTVFLKNTYNIFREGTSLQRVNWITDIFDFSKYDEMSYAIKNVLKELRNNIKYGEPYFNEWERLKTVEKVELEDYSNDITKLEMYIAKNSNGFSAEEIQEANDILSNYPGYNKLDIDRLKELRKQVSLDYSKYLAYKDYRKQLKEYNDVKIHIQQLGGKEAVEFASKAKGKPTDNEKILKIINRHSIQDINKLVRGLSFITEAIPLISELDLIDDIKVIELKDKYEKIQEILKTYSNTTLDKDVCADLLKRFKEPKEVEEVPCPDITVDELDSIISAKRVAESKVSTDLTKYYKKLRDLRILQKENSDKQAKYSIARKRMADIKPHVIEYLNATKKVDIYKILDKAYSNKGLKLTVMHDLCKSLEYFLNTYSYLVFPEPVQFSIVPDEKGIEVLYNTATNITSSVSDLSRGEGNSFDLLLLLVLVQLIPDNKRVNVVILDEVCANMDTPTRKYIHDNYFPILMEYIPHVIILDTSDIPIEYADKYIVQKDGDTSTLLKV